MIGIGIILGVTLAPLVVIAVIYFCLARMNLFFTFVDEGHAKIVGAGGAFKRFLVSFEGFVFDKDWNVVPEGVPVLNGRQVPVGTPGARIYYERHHLFGGLRFYGIYPFKEILRYSFAWTHLHNDGKIVHHKEELDSVLLKTDLYVVELPLTKENAAEDLDGVPLGVAWVIPIKIVNPYKAFFVYRRWLAMVNGVVSALMRTFVARYRYKEDLLDMSAGAGIEDRQRNKGITDSKIAAKEGENLKEKFWKEIVRGLKQRAIEEGISESDINETPETLRVFGVEMSKTGCEPIKIEPDSGYRKLTTMQYEAEQKRKVRIIEAEAERKARSEETVGAIIGMISESTGMTEEDVKIEIAGSAELKKAFFGVATDLVQRQVAIKGKSFMDIRVEGAGADTGLGSVGAFLAMFQKFATRIDDSKEGNKKKGGKEEEET